MSKTNVSSSVGVPLFGTPVLYPLKSPQKTLFVVVSRDDSGASFIKVECVEDVNSGKIPLNFEDSTLSNLLRRGIDIHALDIIDSTKLGVDAGVDALAGHIINNADMFVESSKSE